MCWTTSFLWCDQSTTNRPGRTGPVSHRVAEIRHDLPAQLDVAVDRDLTAQRLRVTPSAGQAGEDASGHGEGDGGRPGQLVDDPRPVADLDVDRATGGAG